MKIAYFVVIISIIAAIGLFTFFRSGESPVSTKISVSDSVQKQQENTRYMLYSKESFAAAIGKKRVYFFHAPWCPTCRPADAEFQANVNKIPQDVVLFKTDYDSSTELKKLYGITYQHTYVLVDDEGNAVKKWNGGALAELVENTQ